MTRKLAPSRLLWWMGAVGLASALWAKRRRRRQFAGKLALVTGGSRGLGLRITAELGRRGATDACDVSDREGV
jgi:hypothetical protein